MNKKIMVAGHLCLDITPRFHDNKQKTTKNIFAPGKLLQVGQAVLSTGGVVSNTGLALAKLGVDVVLNGKTGDDEFGQIIRKLLGSNRAASCAITAGQKSSYTIVIAPPGFDRMFLHYPAANDSFAADDINYDIAASCELFHFGYPTVMKKFYENNGRELTAMYEKIKDTGATSSLDMAMPDPSGEAGKVDWKNVLKDLLPYVDIFLPSIEETAFMLNRKMFKARRAEADGDDAVTCYRTSDYVELAEEMLEMGAAIVVIKAGIKGCYMRSAEQKRIEKIGRAKPRETAVWSGRQMWAPSFKCDSFCSALGAGDTTIAGFICSFVKGCRPQLCLRTANALGWQNVQALDAISGIKSWQQTLEFVNNKDNPCNPVDIDGGWRFCDDQQLYYGPDDIEENQ